MLELWLVVQFMHVTAAIHVLPNVMVQRAEYADVKVVEHRPKLIMTCEDEFGATVAQMGNH